jgi:hypothetical protein
MAIDSKLKSYCVSTLRRAWLRSPARGDALRAARVERGLYHCAICGPDVLHRAKDVQVDHIEPAVDPNVGWQGFDSFILRLFCDVFGLQVICKTHHDAKTREERELARSRKKVLTRPNKKSILKKVKKGKKK